MLDWPGCLAAVRISATHVAHLGKPCLLPGLDASWRTNAATMVSHGLTEAGDNGFCPKPAVSKQQLLRMVTMKGRGDQLALISVASWPFLPRIPSECLPLKGESRRRFSLRWPPCEEALIELVNRELIVKLNMGRRMTAVSRFAWGRICDAYPQESLWLHAPQLFCPVCMPRPAIV